MIILVSLDFKPLVQALGNLYDEPYVELLDPAEWVHDLSPYSQEKTISRLSIIGHSDSYYGEEQTFFGGNLSERVMLIEEFAHSLINLLKHNERINPGFCKHLKHIDLIDCHVCERKFIAQMIAKYFQEDAFLSQFGSHIIISSFANSKHLTYGTILKTHTKDNEALTFYTFHSIQAFNDYRETHYKLAELRDDLHHLEQMPGHTVLLANGKNREETIILLEKQCQDLEKKEHALLKNNTHKVLHITDPRQYLDKHPACQVVVADMPKTSHYSKEPTMKKSAKQPAKHKPHFFVAKTAHHPSKSATHTSYLEGHMFHHKSKPTSEEDDRVPNPHHHNKN